MTKQWQAVVVGQKVAHWWLRHVTQREAPRLRCVNCDGRAFTMSGLGLAQRERGMTLIAVQGMAATCDTCGWGNDVRTMYQRAVHPVLWAMFKQAVPLSAAVQEGRR